MTQQVPHLGYPVTDVVTGFSGIVTGHAVYLSGCAQSLVVPKVAGDGTFREGQWFDDQRLKLSLIGLADAPLAAARCFRLPVGRRPDGAGFGACGQPADTVRLGSGDRCLPR